MNTFHELHGIYPQKKSTPYIKPYEINEAFKYKIVIQDQTNIVYQ